MARRSDSRKAERRRRMRDRSHGDRYAQRARAEGYAARSVYKLEEIDKKVGLLERGQRVLDLGAFPGSWTAFAAERVGPTGRVLGIDLTEHKGALPPNAQIVQGDVTEVDPLDLMASGEATEGFDVVLSDMAPATTGHRFTDQARSFRLFMRALEVATTVLAPGGAFVGKIFQGEDFEEAREALRARFSKVKIVRPGATRDESYEIFLVGVGFHREPHGT